VSWDYVNPENLKGISFFLGHVAYTISHALSVGYIHLSCCSGRFFQKQHYKSSCGGLAIIYRLLNSIILSKWSISCFKHIWIHLLLINSIFLHKLNTFIWIPEALPPVSYWWSLATWDGKGSYIYIGVLVYIIVFHEDMFNISLLNI